MGEELKTMSKKFLIEWFMEVAVMLTLLASIDLIWKGLELLFYGAPQPSWPDTIIGLVLAVSIRKNLRWGFDYRETQS